MSLFAQEGAGALDVVVDAGFRDPELGGEGRVGGALTAAPPDFGSGIESLFDLTGDGVLDPARVMLTVFIGSEQGSWL